LLLKKDGSTLTARGREAREASKYSLYKRTSEMHRVFEEFSKRIVFATRFSWPEELQLLIPSKTGGLQCPARGSQHGAK
jgi:hypothetical protein